MAKKKKKARSFNSEYYLFSQRQNFSEWIKYNYRIISFCALQRNPPFSSWQNGFEMQALNHVCILHLIWSWVRPQGPYHHPHVKKYHVSPPPPPSVCRYMNVFCIFHYTRKRQIECVTYKGTWHLLFSYSVIQNIPLIYMWWYNVLFGRDAVIYFWWWKIYNTCIWLII